SLIPNIVTKILCSEIGQARLRLCRSVEELLVCMLLKNTP
ncbi:MAG: hypothetical protein ACI82S_002527, partial [Patiriisocius sp.]